MSCYAPQAPWGYDLDILEPLDDRSETTDISNAEVRDSPAIPASYKVVGDLIVGPDGEKRRTECIVDAEAWNTRSHLLGCLPPVIRDHDGLDKHIEFHLPPAFPSLLADEVDGRVESLLFPADLVALAVFEGAPEHGKTDDVGMAGRVSESPLAVDADEQGYVVLA